MPRLFIATGLPETVRMVLGRMAHGLPGARWVDADGMHLTQSFIGDVDGGRARAIADGLRELGVPPFTLTLRGVGVFPPRGQPRVLWVGVDPSPALIELKQRVDQRLRRLGVQPERRKYAPHVTLARLKRTPPRRLAEYITVHSLYCSEPFAVDEVRLYSSVLSKAGAKYRVEAAAPLG